MTLLSQTPRRGRPSFVYRSERESQCTPPRNPRCCTSSPPSEAWLVTVTTRLAIDRLRSRKLEREAYIGWWLPEPIIEDEHTPETAAELRNAGP